MLAPRLRLSPFIFFMAVLCLFFAPTQVFAANGASQDSSPLFHGVYAGGLIGVASFDAERSYSGDSIDGMAATGLSNAVFLGTGTVYKNVFLALEGNLAYHNADYSEDIDSSEIEGDIEEAYGANARVGGFLAQNVLAYGLAGWQQVNIDMSDDNNDWSRDERFNGLRFGVGMEYQTNQNVFVRGEYNYTLFSEETINAGGADLDIEPRMGQFQLGIGFRF